MQFQQRVKPVILCGGSGVRLWPLSRRSFPKQLLEIGADQTLLQAAVRRTASEDFLRPTILTSEEHRFLVLDQLAEIDVDPEVVILEPLSRNTAPAIALAAFQELERDPDGIMLVLPSDQLISDVEAFQTAIGKGIPAAMDGYLVTFGVPPSKPETGYGYIRASRSEEPAPGVREVLQFVEKPDIETARRFFESGDYLCNAGLFLFTPRTFCRELSLYAPAVAECAAQAVAMSERDGAFLRPERRSFEACPTISIDYALMEKTQRAAVVPVSMGWSDVGSWEALWELSPKDPDGNVLSDNVVALETSGCVIRTDSDSTVAALGVQDLVVVATRDAILVVPRERSQEIGRVTAILEDQGKSSANSHARVYRPWGSYEIMDRGERFQTKRIIVKPGGILSLQLHHKRSEHWVVVAGMAKITVGEEIRILRENQSAYVPVGTRHRLENPGEVPLHLIEVQCGNYLGEDDIVRLEDTYGRC
jgi:mannose-1-phosphate guanylyltransferase/mannose-6-phosphate isomerase